MKSVNKVILIGNLGQNPELKYTSGGTPVCNLSLATNEQWKDKDGNKQERVDWHTVQVWQKLAEVCGEYLKKGSRIYVEGSLRHDKYEKDGETKYFTKIVAEKLLFLDGMKNNGDAQATSPVAGSPKEDDLPF